MIGRTFGNYRVERLVGEGRIGSVFVAADLQQNRKVAIKFIQPNLAGDPTFQQHFTQEIQAASTLDHTGIVRILQFSDTPGQLYIVMEYIAGGNLATYLKFLARDQKSLESADAMRFAQEIADALEYAFRRQAMTHGDVKLENVLLKTSGTSEKRIFQAVLSDFGAAKLIQGIPGPFSGPSNTSLPFMSPERLRGERVDTRSDIYALGVVLYLLTTGRLPFQPRSLNEAVQMHTRDAVVPPSRIVSTIPREVEQIILKSLAKNPNDRFQTPGEIGQALYGVRFGGPRATHTVVEAAVPGGKNQRTYYADQPISPDMPQYGNFPASAADVGKIRVVFSGQNHPASFLWFDKPVITIGRDATNDIVLDSGQISRHHARIDKGYDGRYRIMDLRSTNGVYLGANKIPPNVSQEWAVGQIARIGDFWMRLEMVNAPSASQNVPGVAAAAPAAGFQSVPPLPVAAPPINGNEVLEHDSPLLKTDFGQSLYTVSPGSRIVVPIKVTNQSEVNDRYSVEVRGLPSDWVTAPGEELRLAPQQTGGAQVIINPPRTGESLAGNQPFSILVRSFQKPEEYDSKKFTLQIESFYGFTTDLHPKRVRSNGTSEFYVTNNGNSADTFAVSLDDPGEEVDIRLDQSELKIDPGQTSRVQIRAVPRRRSIIGSSKSYPFRVSAKPKRTGGEQQVQTAELVVSPILPYWALGGLGITTTGCIFALLLGLAAILRGGSGFNLGGIFGNGGQPVVMTAIPTQPETILLTQIASAGLDSDVDGLTDTEEATVGTTATNPDTDGDGLKDGLEVKSYNTKPTNRDSDADGLTDGDEVNVKGTNPNNPDTDGDGLLDGVDPQPLVKAPPTADAAASQAAAGTQANAAGTGTAASGTSTAVQATAAAPAISINDPPPVVEGNVNGATELVFTISLSKANAGPNPITVNYAFIDGTAKNGSDPNNPDHDYNGPAALPPPPITFAVGGPTSVVLRVPILSNTKPETSFETFSVQLSGASGASIAKGTGIGTISDDDSVLAQPSVSIDDATANENNGPMVFHVTASLPGGSPQLVIPFTTSNGSATAGTEFVTASGNLTFVACPGTTPCTTQMNIPVTLNDDGTPEPTKTFNVVLGPVINVIFLKGTGVGTIVDNDNISVTIDNPTRPEDTTGGTCPSGTKNFPFTVTLSQANTGPNITVTFYTADGTATAADNDYTAIPSSAPQSVTFNTTSPTNQVQTINIPVVCDNRPEPDETFNVILASASGATISKNTGIGTIQNDDSLPQVSINDPVFTEGNPGSVATFDFTVTLAQNNISGVPLTMNFTTVDGGATAGSDYVAQTGIVTFPPAATAGSTQTISIPGIHDLLGEDTETFSVVLSNPNGVILTKSTGIGTINDNDQLTMSIDDPTVSETDPTGLIVFTVTLSQPNPSATAITVNYTVTDGTAANGADYSVAIATPLPAVAVSFGPGEVSKTIKIRVFADGVPECNENFTVRLFNALPTARVTILDSIGVGTILDNDLPPPAACP